jgi:hypothetical protein
MNASFLRVVAAIAIASAARGAAPTTVAEGRWGGPHVLVEVSGSGASIQFDCAHGSISGSIRLDADGRFDVPGDYAPEHGGPIRVGEAEKRRSARYSGRLIGRTMTLSVGLGDDETIGPFTVEHGGEARIVRCR